MTLIEMSISGSIIIVFGIFTRHFLNDLLPKKVFLVIWECCIIRLLIPFTVKNELSVYSYLLPDYLKIEDTINAITSQTKFHSFSGVRFINLIWMSGCSILLMIICLSYFVCRLRFETAVSIKSDILQKWLDEHKLRRKIQVKQSNYINTPLTYGIAKPIILLPLPIEEYNVDSVEYFMTHEYVHIKRFDVGRKILILLILCIHWFNPLVWVLYIMYNKDIEKVCDEQVIRIVGLNSRDKYALALIAMEEKRIKKKPLVSYFGQEAIEERVNSIMKFKEKTIFYSIVSILTVSIAVCICLISSKAKPYIISKMDIPMLQPCDIKSNSFYCSEDYIVDEQVVLEKGYYEAVNIVGDYAIYVPININGERLTNDKFTDGTTFEIGGELYVLHVDSNEYSVTKEKKNE